MDKQEIGVAQDVARHFLSQTVRLSDGSEGHVFSRVPNKNNPQQFVYNCHLCCVVNLSSERALQTHISGRKHQQKLSQPVVDAQIFRTPLTAKPKIQMNIAPGEPIPPGFEDEVKMPSIIQPLINEYKDSALIGIEYCVELTIEDKEPVYICLLCDKRGDQRTIFAHWSSYNHRLKYLEKHFPTIVKELVPFRYNPEAKSIMPRLIEGVIVAIERHHGRLAPSVCENNDFKRKRNIILQEIIAEKHFDEKTGPNFVDAIDRSVVEEENKTDDKEKEDSSKSSIIKTKIKTAASTQFIRNKDRDDLDDISSESDTSLNKSFGGDDYRYSNKNKRKHSRSPIVRGRVQRSPPFDEISSRKSDKKKQNLPTPKELSLQASEIAQERYKWEKYRCLLENAARDLEKQFQNYEKNPEKHPLYPEEWKQFWNRRYKQLQAENKDPNKYDYKPEWVDFWTQRMKEIHQEEIDRKKNEIRRRLNLPEDGEEQTDELKEKYKIKSNHQLINKVGNNSNNKQKNPIKDTLSIIDISDEEMDSPRHSSRISSGGGRRNRKIKSRSKSRSVSLSSLSDFSDKDINRSKNKTYKRRNGRSRSRSFERHRRRSSKSPVKHGREHSRYPHISAAAAQNEYIILRPHPPAGPRIPAHLSYVPRYYAPYRPVNPYKYVKYEEEPLVRESSKVDTTPTVTEKKEKTPEPEDEGSLTVVAVLRLLTALEDNLGSLGPKVVDLLSKALALEKIKANSADDMLMSDDHCVFFETVKEKLKGQLIAEVFDGNKIKTVKRAIKNIATIIHQANERSLKKKDEDDNEKDCENGGNNDSKKLYSNQDKNLLNELPMDRHIISSKLAAALVMQERDDITTDEMNKLIYVLILMIKLSKERDCNMTAKDLLIELGIIEPPSMLLEDDEEIEEEMEIPQEDLSLEKEENKQKYEDHHSESKYQDRHERKKSVEEEFREQKEADEDENNAQGGVGDLESLTDSDLQTLLQNFKHLSSEEQHHLITHLKKLEMTNPARVEKLRKSVNFANLMQDTPTSKNIQSDKKLLEKSKSPQTQLSNKPKPYNIFSDDDDDDDRKLQKMIDSEDDDDDYTFDEVVRAASKNIERKHTDESTQHSLKSISTGTDSHHRQPSATRSSYASGQGDGEHSSSNERHRERDNENTNEEVSKSSTKPSSQSHYGISLDAEKLIANIMGSLQKNKNTHQSQTNSQPIPTTSQQQQLQQQQQAKRHSNSMTYQQLQSSYECNNMYPSQSSQQPRMDMYDMNNMNNMNTMYYGNNPTNQHDYMQNYNNQPIQPPIMDAYNSYNQMSMNQSGMGMYNQMPQQQHNPGGMYQNFNSTRQYR